MHIENITKIACAIQSCYNGCLDELKGDLDEKNIGQMFARMNRVNAIPKLFESQPKFKPDPTLENIPDMDNDESRLYATVCTRLISHSAIFSSLVTMPDVQYVRLKASILVKARGLKSRFGSKKVRQVFLLYEQSNAKFVLVDTMCNRDGGLRPIGGCAHSTAILRFLHETKSGSVPSKTYSKLVFEQSIIGSDSDSDSSGSSTSD